MSGTIRKLDAFEVTVPLPRPLALGGMSIADRRYCIVRIEDGDGRVGVAYGLTRNAPVAATVARTVAPLWQGAALDGHHTLYEKTVRANVCLGTGGIFWRALSLCDCALYDLLAQRAGQPLGVFLGGMRRRVKHLLVGGYPSPDETAEALAEQMHALASQRPDGVKVASCGDFARDVQRLETCRGALGGDTPLMLDLFWQVNDPRAFAKQAAGLTGLGMGWIEDPVGFDDYDGLKTLRRTLDVPIAMGDEQSGRRTFEQLTRPGRVDVVRLDATVCGGVRAFIAIAAMAQERGLKVACHMADQLHLQLAHAAPNVAWVERMPEALGLDSAHLLWADAGDRGGPTPATPRPGVGIVWDDEALERYRSAASW